MACCPCTAPARLRELVAALTTRLPASIGSHMPNEPCRLIVRESRCCALHAKHIPSPPLKLSTSAVSEKENQTHREGIRVATTAVLDAFEWLEPCKPKSRDFGSMPSSWYLSLWPTLGCLRRHFLRVTSCRTRNLALDDGCMTLPRTLLKQHATLGPRELGPEEAGGIHLPGTHRL